MYYLLLLRTKVVRVVPIFALSNHGSGYEVGVVHIKGLEQFLDIGLLV